MVDDLPFGVGIGNDAGIAGRRLDVVQVCNGVANHRLAIANKDVLTDRRRRIVIRAIGIVDGLCRWGYQSRHPAVGSPLSRLTRVAMVHVTQSTQITIGTRGIDSHQQTLRQVALVVDAPRIAFQVSTDDDTLLTFIASANRVA